MPRRGWTAMDIPSGWVQVLRGPRPKSEKWPVASSGRQPTFNQQAPTRGRQPAPRSNVRAPNPDAALEHARSKVSSLEAALTAMGSHQGPEVDALRSALQKAKQAAQERPLKVQLAQTDAFVERSRLRIKKLEEEREAELELLNAALQRQARLREQVAAEPPMTVTSPVTTNPSEEIARLKAKVAQLEAVSNHPPRCSAEAAEAVKMRAAKRRAWVCGRQFAERRASVVRMGRFQNVGVARCHRCGGFGVSDCIDESDRSRCIQDEISNATTVDSVQYGCFLRPAEVLIEVNREARNGHRGQRVGEAAHPGPVRRLRKVADLQKASRLGTQLTMVDSDDDRPLLRDVAPLHSPDHAGIWGAELVRHPTLAQSRLVKQGGGLVTTNHWSPTMRPGKSTGSCQSEEAASALATSIALVLGQRHGVRRTCAAAAQNVAEICCHTSGRIFERR